MSIFNNNKPVKHNGRTGFDLSSDHVFDMRAGICRPVVAIDTVPNSSYRINAADIIRTGSLQTAAFLRGRQELDFFFVPYSQLCSYFYNVAFGRGDQHSAAIVSINRDELPSCPLVALVYAAAVPYVFEYAVRATGREYIKDALTDLGIIDNIHSAFQPGRFISTFTYNTNLYGSNEFNEALVSDISFVGGDLLRILSSLGYGDYTLLIDNTIIPAFEAFGTHLDDAFGNFLLGDVQSGTLLSVLNSIDSSAAYSSGHQINGDKMVSLMRLAAFNKIWSDVYRDSILDDSLNYVTTFSLDLIRNPYQVTVDQNDYFTNDCISGTFLLAHYLRMYQKDLSCGIYPESQFGAHGTLTSFEDDSYDGITTDTDSRRDAASALNIRFALALQRYKETLLRAGNRAKDLMRSEFGVESKYIQDTYVRHLGSFGGALDLNKVSATAETGSYSVGDLAGNVFSSLNGDTIDFTCNDYGVIIGVMSVIALPMHNAFGVSPFNHKLTQFDFYHEEFENLGLQPVGSDVFSAFGESFTLGFSARYNEYKQNIDQVHDSFCTLPPVNLFPGYTRHDGSNTNYVVVRPIGQVLGLLRNRSYMLPSIMNSLFVAYDNGLIGGSHFQVSLSVNVSAVLPMSQMGLPY